MPSMEGPLHDPDVQFREVQIGMGAVVVFSATWAAVKGPATVPVWQSPFEVQVCARHGVASKSTAKTQDLTDIDISSK